jgi:hypothetical protein
MSSLTNVNNNASVVVVGRTAPVEPGQQRADKSIPVVLASDQPTIPVAEQNKIASEVALSLLGIPRSEVALGIFADVNTYDVNPSEWSPSPEIRQDLAPASDPAYTGFAGDQGWGVKHIPSESGALVEAPADKIAVLTSKRFFRYQPGRVSSTTFGVKTSVIPGDPLSTTRNPAIRKYGSFDSFDGYYWETRDTGIGDQAVVVRRTTSIIKQNPLPFGTSVNQQTEDYGIVGSPPSAGNANGTAGNLVVLRDGLLHVHAAVYDPSLLRNETNHTFGAITTNAIRLAVADGEVYNGQHVSYITNETAVVTGLVKSRIYKVINKTAPSGGNYTVQLTELNNDNIITLGTLSGTHLLRTPVPFIFPSISTAKCQDIMWPLKRSFDFDRTAVTPVGIVDTTLESISTTVAQMITINDGSIETHWANWVLWNVKPEFYGVYEFRVPRSRWSGDFLDGNVAGRPVYYSDLVRTGTGGSTVKRPGQAVLDENEDIVLNDSIWNLDFTKVTMQKVEFSWYGAVGALFLAYVPISNGEARWVRVHHLRCSNQLKVASLGNATLPITYLVYGGGSQQRYGYSNLPADGLRNQSSIPGATSYSQFIVKYGASYYIDGGDRGTVRLYSYSSQLASEISGSKYRMKVNATQSQAADPYLTVDDAAPYNVNPAVSDFYMNAAILTSDIADQGVKVSWIDSANKRLYLNKSLSSLTGASVKLDVLVDRPEIIYGLETKDVITSSQGNSVRNRVQVYPTRLATGAAGSSTVSLQLRKNPIFQTFTAYSGTLTLNSGTTHILKPAGNPTTLTLSATPTLADGGSKYGWMRAYFTDDIVQTRFAVLGILKRSGSTYTFTAESSYSRETRIIGSFMVAVNYNNDGTVVTTVPSKTELERLSSVNLVNDLRTPIPGTGLQVTTFYIQPGGQQFELSPYFDYNKDYLSYPLTNKLDSLYLTSSSVDRYINIDGSGDPTGSAVVRSSVLASITWEEQ